MMKPMHSKSEPLMIIQVSLPTFIAIILFTPITYCCSSSVTVSDSLPFRQKGTPFCLNGKLSLTVAQFFVIFAQQGWGFVQACGCIGEVHGRTRKFDGTGCGMLALPDEATSL